MKLVYEVCLLFCEILLIRILGQSFCVLIEGGDI